MCPFGTGFFFFFKLSMSLSFIDCDLLLVILKYEPCLVYGLSIV